MLVVAGANPIQYLVERADSGSNRRQAIGHRFHQNIAPVVKNRSETEDIGILHDELKFLPLEMAEELYWQANSGGRAPHRVIRFTSQLQDHA